MAQMAAVLACGESAVLSHRSAATLWDLLPRRSGTTRVDVTVAADRGRRPGVRVCRVRTLRADETTTHEGIPVTTVTRTLLDLAGLAEQRELERALAAAFDRDDTDRGALLAMLSRHAGRTGAKRLRALLQSDTPAALTRSEAEERFLSLIRKAQLPAPATNVRVHGHEVDFYWRAERLVVEIDGFAFHSSATSFERDRHRDAKLAAAGVRVTRVTWRQLENEPEAVLVRLAQAIARSP
jgi:very-short-patch-repair endonuclease